MRISDRSSDVCSSDLPQGRETCRLPILQRQIDPARRPDINLRATVLVDEDLLRARFLELRHQKILDDGLARAGRTDNQCVTQIADMEVEIIGRLRGRLHHGDRRPPMVPLGPARSEEHTSELQSLMRISYAVFC